MSKKFPYPFDPMAHQVAAMKLAWHKPHFAWFHAMGTGKTASAIWLSDGRFRQDLIDAHLVICPTPIKQVWETEYTKCSVVEHEILVLESATPMNVIHSFVKKKSNKLKVFVVGVEALSAGKAFDWAKKFAVGHRCQVTLDEASKIKNATSNRSKRTAVIGAQSDFRLALTGSPITQGMQDLFGIFRFLHPSIIGCKSFVLFRNRYCVMGGFENRSIKGYQNVDDLMDKVSPFCDMVTKEMALDLPPKVYIKRSIQPSPHQLDAIQQLKDMFEAEVEGDVLIASTVLERLTRYQQIIGGNFPFNIDDGEYDVKPMAGRNPKLDDMIGVIEDEIPDTAKCIIWARFRPEIDQIAEKLRSRYGQDSVVEFHGGIPTEERKLAVKRFREDSTARFFISNQATGGMGLTLVEATYTFYFSNSFSYEDRIQSEDRNHRKGQTNSVTYIDFEMDHPYDKMILKAIKYKGGVAKFVENKLLDDDL